MNGNSYRGKTMPSKASQDTGYSSYGSGQSIFSYSAAQKAYGYNDNNTTSYDPTTSNGLMPAFQESMSRVMLDGYRKEMLNGRNQDEPSYGQAKTIKPQSSMALDINDPIQIHLLVETALGDSKEFEILPQEEVDQLKKQCQNLSQRIEQTRQNLAIQSKYRDAAISMAKLYSPSDKSQDAHRPRRSLLEHNRNNSDQIREAERERVASEQRCQALALELFNLERRNMESQSRLLKHTAGILQMTHKGPKRTPKSQISQQSGMPGSPESMLTYSNSRNSVEPTNEELSFDDRSLYKEANYDSGQDFGFDSLAMPSKTQLQLISRMELRLEDLNRQVRQIVVKANPALDQTYEMPPATRNAATTDEDHLQNQLVYLERSVTMMDQESAQVQERHQKLELAMEQNLEEMNRQIHQLLMPFNTEHTEPPKSTGAGLDEHASYFQASMGALEIELARAAASTSKATSNQDSIDQMETVMTGLWQIIKSGEEEERSRKMQRRQARTAQNLPGDEDDSPDEDSDPNEQFTLQAFSAKVQWLYAQATRLKDQKKVLQRQIKQQRELNNKSDATKDADLAQKTEELTRTTALLTRTEADADRVREQLSQVMDQLDEARQQENLRNQARADSDSAAVRAAEIELNDRSKRIAALEEQLLDMEDDKAIGHAELQGKIADSESRIAALTAELATTAAAAAFAKDKDSAIQGKDKELDEANMEIARLQTEVTIARAELDGAYGSRAQRAAEVAANPAIQKEIDNLTKNNAALTAEIDRLKQGGSSDEKMMTLKRELEETIEEYEQMTKASIEWEKERESLESTIDKLRDEREQIETELSDEKVKWLGMKSPGAEGGSQVGNTSTTVLKNEFKKMMRDTRAENAKILRAEQAERRRLEDELRALKRAQGPGKSGLSQSIGA